MAVPEMELEGASEAISMLPVNKGSADELPPIVPRKADGSSLRQFVQEVAMGDSQQQQKTSGRKSIWLIFMVGLASMLVFADQNLLAPNLTAVAREFGMDDAERDWLLGGVISALFFLIGAPASIIVGHMADTKNRITLFLVVLLIGELPCVLTPFVRSFAGLVITRLFTGMSLGGCIPIAFSLVGDVVPSTYRTLLSGGYGMVTGGGAGFGQLVAGITGERYGWRLCFALIGVPAILVGFLMYMTTEEPLRGGADGTTEQLKEDISFQKTVRLLRCRTNVIVFVQAAFGCLPWGVIIAYLNDFLAQDSGLGVINASVTITVFGVACSIGSMWGAVLGQHYENTHRHKIGLLTGLTTLAGLLPSLFLVVANSEVVPTWAFYVTAACAGFLSSATGPNISAVVLNVNSADTRGSAFAMFNLFNDVGKGLGPFLGSIFIQTLGRKVGLAAALLGWVPCGVACLFLTITYPRDVRSLKARLKTASDDGHAAELGEFARG